MPFRSTEHDGGIIIESLVLIGNEEVPVSNLTRPVNPSELDGVLRVRIDEVPFVDELWLPAMPLFWLGLIEQLHLLVRKPPETASIITLNGGGLTIEPVRGDRALLRYSGPGGVRKASLAVDRRRLMSALIVAAEKFLRDFAAADRDSLGLRIEGDIAALRSAIDD
jgi:hypothetical protein